MTERQWQRVVACVDLDAFYAQVEAKLNPELKGKPLGVVQYNPFGSLETIPPHQYAQRLMNDSNGSLIAVSYEARKFGVKRNMRGDEARKLCPELQLVQVPTAHGKADLTAYRSAGKQVMNILAERCGMTERASIDECYLDVTEEANRRLKAAGGHPELPPPECLSCFHICGMEGEDIAAAWWERPAEAWGPGERALAAGAAAVAEARARVEQQLDFTCSAGLAPTKILAKLSAGLHKPRQQTLVPQSAITGLLKDLPIGKLRMLGGKLGDQVQEVFGISTVGELAAVPQSRLDHLLGEEKGRWLSRLARGLDDEVVKPRLLPKSVGCSKTFRGHHALRTLPIVHQWLLSIGKELEERLEEDRVANNRQPQLLTVGVATSDWQGREDSGSFSRSCPLAKPTAAAMADGAVGLIKRWASAAGSGWAIYSLCMSTGNFAAAPTGASTLTRFLKPKSTSAGSSQPEGGSSSSNPNSMRLTCSPAKPSRQAQLGASPSKPQQKPQSGVSLGMHGISGRSAAPFAPMLQRQPQAAAQQQQRQQQALQPPGFASAATGAPDEHVVRQLEPDSSECQPSGACEPYVLSSDDDEHGDDIIVDIDAATPERGRRQQPDTKWAALSSGEAGAPEPVVAQAARDSRHADADGAAPAADPVASGWMPTTLSEVNEDVMSALPLQLQAEIRASLKAQHRSGPQKGALHAFFSQKPTAAKQNVGSKRRRT